MITSAKTGVDNPREQENAKRQVIADFLKELRRESGEKTRFSPVFEENKLQLLFTPSFSGRGYLLMTLKFSIKKDLR